MSRWYEGFACYGKPQAIMSQISNLVYRYNLGKYVPVARVEKKARGGQFYLFLAIDSPVIGEVPQEVRSQLYNILPALRTSLKKPFMFEEIRPFVGAEHDIRDYAGRIPYLWKSDPLVSDDDPFDLDTPIQPLSDRENGEDFLVRTQNYDHLLFWLSAVGSGSRDIFRRTCQAIGLDTNGIESRHA